MSDAPIKADTSATSSVKPLRVPRGFWVAASLLLLAASTFVAFTQSPRPDPFQAGRFLSLDWWRYPLERNSHKRLPEIKCDLNAIFALPDGNHVWAVGNLGMIVHSNDGGKTWTQQKIEISTGSVGSEDPGFSASPTPTATPQPRNIGSTSPQSSNLIPAAYADALPQSNTNPRQQIDPKQQSQRPTPTPTINSKQSNLPYEQKQQATPTPTPRPVASSPTLERTPTPQLSPAIGSPTLSMTPTPAPSVSFSVTMNTKVADENLIEILFEDAQRGAVYSQQGNKFTTTDGGKNWKPESSTGWKLLGPIHSVHAINPLTGWAVGKDGIILWSTDGGKTWIHLTQGTLGKALASDTGNYSRWPAPWYYVACLLSALLLVPALKPRPEDALTIEESVADVGVSDRPIDAGDPDPLSFNSIALGLSRFIRNEKTLPPLTIAITGEWGTGKSSLMNLLRADLRRYGFRPVWFNAWHHQKEEHLLASLLQNIKLQSTPRWWTPEGVLFRLRLLAIRGWRNWIPVLALLLVFAFSLSYAWHHPSVLGDFSKNFGDLVAMLTGKGAAKEEGGEGLLALLKLPALLVSLIGVIVGVWRGMKAFGVNPASLMANVTQSMKIRHLDEQTSFRQKFAQEFSDVTKALGARSMPIFVDDLDRCRPNNVLDVLEAVNFLASSGDCYVVMGMARDRVERCVGLSFKDIAEEMSDAAPVAAENASESGRQKRSQFARQYLDKLINIEVPVPTPTADQTQHLLVPQQPAPPSRSAQFKRAVKTQLTQFWPWLLMTSVIALGILMGRYVGQTPPQVIEPQPTPTVAPSLQASPQPTRPAPSASATPLTPSPTPDPRQDQSAELVQPTSLPTHPPYWLLALIALPMIGAAIWYFRQPRDLIVKDSPEFEKALQIWHPLVYAKQSSPRSIKRFMNRVRYLAMRQRPSRESQSRWKEIALIIGNRLGFKQKDVVMAENSKIIPESVLVALTAIHHYNPNWIEDRAMFYKMIVPSDKRSSKHYSEVLENHINQFGAENWAKFEDFRHVFLKMSSGIQVN